MIVALGDILIAHSLFINNSAACWCQGTKQVLSTDDTNMNISESRLVISSSDILELKGGITRIEHCKFIENGYTFRVVYVQNTSMVISHSEFANNTASCMSGLCQWEGFSYCQPQSLISITAQAQLILKWML